MGFKKQIEQGFFLHLMQKKLEKNEEKPCFQLDF